MIGDACRKTRALARFGRRCRAPAPAQHRSIVSVDAAPSAMAVSDSAIDDISWQSVLSVASDNERAISMISERAEIRDQAAAAGATASLTTTGDRDSQPAQALFDQRAGPLATVK